jgi:hypothetical protein
VLLCRDFEVVVDFIDVMELPRVVLGFWLRVL